MIEATHTFEEVAIKIGGCTVGYCQSITVALSLEDDGTIDYNWATIHTSDGPDLELSMFATCGENTGELIRLMYLLYPEIMRRAAVECPDFVRHIENATVYNEDDEHRLAKNQLI